MGIDALKVVKLLQLSQSPNDNEALAAIRKANELVRTGNGSWERFFGTSKEERPKESSKKHSYDPSNEPEWLSIWEDANDEEREVMLEFACNHAKAPYDALCKSISEAYFEFGTLSDKQILCIMRSCQFNGYEG